MNNPRRALAFLLVSASVPAQSPGDYFVYFGTYSGPESKGIYVCRFDSRNGKVTKPEIAAEIPNPSFLAIHPSRRFLYAVGETGSFAGRKMGAVAAFRIDDKTGKLTAINEVGSGGPGPCFVSVDKTGKAALVANYGGGSVAAFPIKGDGSLGEASSFIQHTGSSVNPKRQAGPHAHSINPSPDNRFAVAADLGLDKLLVYRFDAGEGTLAANNPPFTAVRGGAGPRHFAFHPDGRNAYVINEMQSTVTAFSWDPARGVLKEFQTVSTLPKDHAGDNSTAEVAVHPSGRFLYGSNRGHDSIAVFTIDARGALSPVEHVPTQGSTPRNFAVDPTGNYLFAANQRSNNVVVFRIDGKTGRLTATGTVLEVGSPVCVRFVRAGS